MTAQQTEIKQWMEDVSRGAGKILMSYFEKDGLVVSEKTGPNDLVTEADIAAEKMILDRLAQDFPDDAYVSEESGKSDNIATAEWVWIIDPLDGTNNFAKGSELFGTMMTRARNPFRDGIADMPVAPTAEAAAIFVPYTDTFYFAQRKGGAWINDRRIHFENGFELHGSRITIGYHLHQPGSDWIQRLLMNLEDHHVHTMALHSAAMSIVYLLEGNSHAHVMNDIYPWDFAPMQLLAVEAGLTAHRPDGEAIHWWEPSGGFVMTSRRLFHTLQNLIQ